MLISSLLKLHLHQCEKQRNFQEAINVSQKINELEKIEKEKLYESFSQRQIEEKTQLEIKLAESKENIDEEKIIEQQSFDLKIQNLIDEFNNKQELELINFKIGLENAIPLEPNLHEINIKYEKYKNIYLSFCYALLSNRYYPSLHTMH